MRDVKHDIVGAIKHTCACVYVHVWVKLGGEVEVTLGLPCPCSPGELLLFFVHSGIWKEKPSNPIWDDVFA